MIISNPESDLTYRLLKVVADADAYTGLYWLVEHDNVIAFFVDVTKEFGRPLLVRVTEDNIHVLEDALDRVMKLTHDNDLWPLALLLFACRARSERPPAAAYPQGFKALWPWLDICGPARQTICKDEPLRRTGP